MRNHQFASRLPTILVVMEIAMQKDHLEILLEEMNSKFTLVLEGQTALLKDIQYSRKVISEKLDLVNFKIEVLSDKLDAV